jgi:hypothetical protein
MKVQLASFALTLLLGLTALPAHTQTNDQDRKQAAAEAKADKKADKAQAHADKDEHKALKSSKVRNAAKSQDKADAAAANAASR